MDNRQSIDALAEKYILDSKHVWIRATDMFLCRRVLISALTAQRAATLEEAATVADKYWDSATGIAAAIRALVDKPPT